MNDYDKEIFNGDVGFVDWVRNDKRNQAIGVRFPPVVRTAGWSLPKPFP